MNREHLLVSFLGGERGWNCRLSSLPQMWRDGKTPELALERWKADYQTFIESMGISVNTLRVYIEQVRGPNESKSLTS